MPLVQEALRPTADEKTVIRFALGELGDAVAMAVAGGYVRTKGHTPPSDQPYAVEPRNHLQDGLPSDHEVSVWGFRSAARGEFSILQQLIRWEGEDKDRELSDRAPRELVTRPDGDSGTATIPGLNWENAPFETTMQTIADTHATVNWYLEASGQSPSPPALSSSDLV